MGRFAENEAGRQQARDVRVGGNINDLLEEHIRERERVKALREARKEVDSDTLIKLDNSLALAITALNGTKRTQALFKGTEVLINDAFDEALNSLAIFKKEPYLIEARAEEAVEEVWVEEEEAKN
jgi:hypothetical protein